MRNDSTRVIAEAAPVTKPTCFSAWTVHHRDFPELRVEGYTAREGVERLGRELSLACDWVCDPWRRDALTDALSDIDAYLGRDVAVHA